MIRTLILASTLALPGLAGAQTLSGNDPAPILGIAKAFGPAELSTDNQGDPLITGEIEGVRYGILFYGCDQQQGCNSIQFIGFFDNIGPTSLQRVNDWNADQRYGTAFLEPDGDIVFNWSLNLDRGVTPDNLRDSFDIWAIALPSFFDFLYPS